MTKPRKPENQGLPRRWRRLHGAYYYAVPPGQEAKWNHKKLFRLGATLDEAYETWSKQSLSRPKIQTIADLLDQYACDEVPKKAVRTRPEYLRAVRRLRAVFGALPLDAMEPGFVYKYFNKRKAKVAARRDIAVLSHAFTKAIEWCCIKAHPFATQVKLEGETPRDRYITDEELAACLSLSSRRKKGSVRAIQAYLLIKVMTGMSKGDLLLLREDENIRADGIHTQRRKVRRKTGVRTIYAWTDELRAAVEAARAARPVASSSWLFCDSKGNCYFNEVTERCDNWDSMWKRFVSRVLRETNVKERFTDHDFRAKGGSDAETLEQARALLAHADSKTTRRIYRRKPEIVTPVRKQVPPSDAAPNQQES